VPSPMALLPTCIFLKSQHTVSPLKMVLQLQEESVAFSHPGDGVPEGVPDMSLAFAQEILLSHGDLYNGKNFPIVRQTWKN